jgi:hypothetical protein
VLVRGRRKRRMDGVEGMMKGLKLSEEERAGVKIGWRGGGKMGVVHMQAVGKLLAEKPALAEAIEDALGPVWCPMKGIDVKDLGENIFLFTFHQEGGKKKAVDSGPWRFEKDLMVMEEFVPTKAPDEYEFNRIPIWVRVFKLPWGMMDYDTAESIGNRIGEFLAVDGMVDGLAMGKYLRIQVRMLITKPLMRGTTVEIAEGKRTIWCPFEYEYLPDFCYTCGIIGHLDRGCSLKLKKGEVAQYGRELRWLPPKRMSYGEPRRIWSNNGRGTQGGWGTKGREHGSDSQSWRKTEFLSNGSGRRDGREEVGARPLKITDGGMVNPRNDLQNQVCVEGNVKEAEEVHAKELILKEPTYEGGMGRMIEGKKAK